MTERAIVCPGCGEAVPYGRLSCPECGTPTVKRGPARTGQYFWSCARWRRDGSGCHARPVWITAARA